jgi:hypothetical protein
MQVRRHILAACAAGLVLTACGQPDGRGAGEDGGDDGKVAVAADKASPPFAETGRWIGETATGTPIVVTTPNPPIRPGSISLRIQVPNAGPETLPVSVDLVAPDMPMHGITRFDAEAISTDEYLVEMELPMEGRWLVYVNLDIGVNAASFEVDVPPSDGGGHENHESPQPEEEPGPATNHQHS